MLLCNSFLPHYYPTFKQISFPLRMLFSVNQ